MAMDPARRILDRLERIEAMRDSAAPVEDLLGELRGLLDDGQAWLASEGPCGTARAATALGRLAAALQAHGERERLPAEEVVDPR